LPKIFGGFGRRSRSWHDELVKAGCSELSDQPGRAITEQLDRLYPGAGPRRRAAEQRLRVGGRAVLAQEENSPMVARPNKPIYPACVPPKSHPPTSRELFVPASGTSPKTSVPASATVSKR
jgi:hypothetical protein